MTSAGSKSRLALVLAAFASVIAVQVPLIAYKTFANVDEAYAAALASRVLDGYKLYEGAVSQRGPLMYYLFALAAKLHGWDNIVAFRCWALAFSLAHLACVYWAGRALFSRQVAALATGFAGYALAFGFPASDGIALHGEALQVPPLVAACVWGALAVRALPASRTRLKYLALSGLAFGVAIGIKQSAALHPLPLAAWLVIDAKRRRQPLSRVVRDVGVLGAGTVLVPLLCVLNSAREGTLAKLYYYCVVYNRDVHLKPTKRIYPWLTNVFFRLSDQTLFFLVMFVVAGIAASALIRRLQRYRGSRDRWVWLRGYGAEFYMAANAFVAIGSASTMWRFFPHYYVQGLPFLLVTLAALLVRSREGRAPLRFRGAGAGFVAFMLFAATMGTIFGERIDGRVTHDRTPQMVGRYIEASTEPNDRILVWGFSPWVYQYAHRKPASRFVFHTYVTGFVPWFWDKLSVERARIVPGSVEGMLEDLERERPEILVDAGSVMIARSLRLYPATNAYLHRHYCFESRIGGFDIYRRTPKEGAECKQPWFPIPYDAIDWNGRPLGVPLPKTLDANDSHRLPRGNFNEPIWFREGNAPPSAALAAAADKKQLEEEREAAEEGFVIDRFDPQSPSPRQ